MDEWKKQLDLLVEESMSFIQSVGTDAPVKIDFREIVALRMPQGVARHPEFSVQQPMAAEVATSKSRLDRERDLIQRRVANFKAHQKKFQQEREEYYARTMANARATQWTPSKPR